LILQLLVGLSLVLAGYQDVKERKVRDFFWLPGAVGLAIAILILRSPSLVFAVVLVGIIAFFVAKAGMFGQADGIAFLFIIADPAPYAPAPALIVLAFVVVAHSVFLYRKGFIRKLTISLDRFNSEAQWIPRSLIVNGVKTMNLMNVNNSRERIEKASKARENDEVKQDVQVEVVYGVPTVAYIAVAYVGYVVFLAFAAPHFLFSVP
jgi:hypothetical protein